MSTPDGHAPLNARKSPSRCDRMDGARIRRKLTRQLAAALRGGSSLFSRMVVGHWLVYSLRRKIKLHGAEQLFYLPVEAQSAVRSERVASMTRRLHDTDA